MKLRRYHILHKCERVFDIVFNPLSITCLANICIIFLFIPGGTLLVTKGLILLGFTLLTTIFPIIIGLLIKRAKVITQFWHPSQKKDRRMLILITLLFFTSSLSLANSFHLPLQIKMVSITAIYLMCILFLINLFTDIVDGHYAALAAYFTLVFLFGTTFRLNVLPLLSAILAITGIKAAVQIECHRLKANELLISWTIGFIITLYTGIHFHFSI